MFEIKRQKKDVDFSYCKLRFGNNLCTKIRKAHDMLAGVFHLFCLVHNLKFSRFQFTKNKQKRFLMSLKLRLQKYKNFLIRQNDSLAKVYFPLAKFAKSQSLFHVSREFTRIFWNELWLLAIGFWQK